MSVFLLFWLMADAHHVIDLLNHITCIKTFRARLIYREISLLTCFDFIDLFYNLFLIISFTKGSGTFFFFYGGGPSKHSQWFLLLNSVSITFSD